MVSIYHIVPTETENRNQQEADSYSKWREAAQVCPTELLELLDKTLVCWVSLYQRNVSISGDAGVKGGNRFTRIAVAISSTPPAHSSRRF